jgi:protein-tyrosine kinase
MDKISEVMERARGISDQGDVPARSGRVMPLREPTVHASPVEKDFRYTRTRTVTVSRKTMREQRIVAGFDGGPYQNACKILGTQILQRMKEGGWNALAVTSPGAREGKSLVAINLAISLGQEVDRSVLLVDADLRAPRIHRYFGLPDGPGLSDYLVSGMPLEDILVHPGLGRFLILPGGIPIQNSSEHLGSERMFQLVQELKGRYPGRIVIFDLPPLLAAADALAFAPHVDAAVLVIEEGATDQEAVQRAADMLGSTPLLGTVLNKSLQEKAPAEQRARRGWFSRRHRAEV